MRRLISSTRSLLLLVLFSSVAHATFFEQEGQYILQVTPWSQSLKDTGQTALIVKGSLRAMENELTRMIEAGIVPKEISSIEDIRKLRKAEGEIEDAVEELNKWITEVKKMGRFQWGPDLVPDAILICAGGKISANLGIGGGASVMIGAVVMPVMVTQIDKTTGKVVKTYPSVRVSLVGWGAPDIGTGVGGGVVGRVGIGLIWGSDHFNDPKQMAGVGLGVSKGVVLSGVGFNLKAGFINNFGMPDVDDLIYGIVSWEGGLAAKSEFHVNGIMITSLTRLLEMFGASSASYVSTGESRMRSELDRLMINREMTPATTTHSLTHPAASRNGTPAAADADTENDERTTVPTPP